MKTDTVDNTDYFGYVGKTNMRLFCTDKPFCNICTAWQLSFLHRSSGFDTEEFVVKL